MARSVRWGGFCVSLPTQVAPSDADGDASRRGWKRRPRIPKLAAQVRRDAPKRRRTIPFSFLHTRDPQTAEADNFGAGVGRVQIVEGLAEAEARKILPGAAYRRIPPSRQPVKLANRKILHAMGTVPAGQSRSTDQETPTRDPAANDWVPCTAFAESGGREFVREPRRKFAFHDMQIGAAGTTRAHT
jgi:hypothetical protein